MAKKSVKKGEPMKAVVITATKIKKAPEPARLDSMQVGTKKRSIADVARVTANLNKSPNVRSYLKGVNASAPYKSRAVLTAKNSASDIINKAIDNEKKKKPSTVMVAKRK